jgi:hypothetical protein
MDAQEQILGDYKARHNSDLPEQLAGNIAALQRPEPAAPAERRVADPRRGAEGGRAAGRGAAVAAAPTTTPRRT